MPEKPAERDNGPFPYRPAFPFGNRRDAEIISKKSGQPIERFLGDGMVRRAVIAPRIRVLGGPAHRIISIGEGIDEIKDANESEENL